uniref:Uncharacterized protein n=1 Tax=Romanomermis culicivorax TaxID=13658 RepID=A0A915J8M5_ROMCU
MASVIGCKKKKSPIGGSKFPEALSTIPMLKKFKKKTVGAALVPSKKKTVKVTSFSETSKVATAQSPAKRPISKLSVVNPKMADRRTNKKRWAMTICVLFVLLTLGSIGGLTFYTVMSVREVLSTSRRIIQRRSDALALPYTTDNLTKSLKPGDMFIVTGYPIPEHTFHVVLSDGSLAKSQNASSPPHIWKLSVVDDAGFVMMTDRWNGQWGDEEILLDGRNADLRLKFDELTVEDLFHQKLIASSHS